MLRPGATVTPASEREYVRQWVETGRVLEDLRWRELQALDPTAALEASRQLIDAALRVPLPSGRLSWSGLVDLQDRLHGRLSR